MTFWGNPETFFYFILVIIDVVCVGILLKLDDLNKDE